MFKSLSMLNCTILQKHIKVFIVLKHPSRVHTFYDLLNFVNAITVSVATDYVITTLTKYYFFLSHAGSMKYKSAKI